MHYGSASKVQMQYTSVPKFRAVFPRPGSVSLVRYQTHEESFYSWYFHFFLVFPHVSQDTSKVARTALVKQDYIAHALIGGPYPPTRSPSTLGIFGFSCFSVCFEGHVKSRSNCPKHRGKRCFRRARFGEPLWRAFSFLSRYFLFFSES